MIRLSNRLLVVANMVDKNITTLDIGCDHALLDVYLVQNNNNHCIVSDINENALNQAKKNIEKYNVECESRLGDGLNVINKNDDIDTIIISGLGGINIIKILNKIDRINNNTINSIIIQSNSDIILVRKTITKLGFMIADEELVIDNNITYTVIKFKKGNRKYSFKELFLGPVLIKKKSELFCKKVNTDLIKYKKVYSSIPFKYVVKKYYIRKIIRLLKKSQKLC